ncbi:uncharacterized protein J4E84_010302 [Alternaria hordeiaustralica]|uniref:uncharacterized protein n=1 Tax=Alternaria hordeiaustralica TaxID=1187925 RepID=UPI0020C2D3E6|nr:uncharacterized protein J4E84_010302 [Alternaria hordeiaustralica]KAI4674861.1 hypothetical protein J4E84_010302 [Alternaria hordeiaustralica]
MDSDDDDLKLAMAMSLQTNSPRAAHSSASGDKHESIDLTSDTEDEDDDDLRRAIALSMQESASNDVQQSSAPSSSPTSATKTAAVADKPPGFMGMDRKAMELERLARLGKRKREASPEAPSKQVARAPAAKSDSGETPLQYPNGAIKRTFASKYPRTDDITIEELLEADKVNTAVISSFQYDSGWLYEKLDPTKVKQIWLMTGKHRGEDVQAKRIQEWRESRVPNMKLHFPPMGGMIASMHSKFMLLFGKDKLRIAVPTANMTQTDWGEVANDWQPGIMENSVFLIDLPRRHDGTVTEAKDLTPFGRELVYFLEQQEVGPQVITGLLRCDFSKTSHLAFVHSIGGSHKTESVHPTGLPGLAHAIRELHLDDVACIELDYAASSLGSINDAFLSRIRLAACGKSFGTDTATEPNVRDCFRIYFPTNDTVEKSMGGPDGAGIITLTRQTYNAPTFPKECMRDYDSMRRGMLSHNKLLFARGRGKNGKPFAWVYVGSANISESAWGGQKVLKSGQMGSLNIRNWECGVVMPVPESELQGLKQDDVPPMSVFDGTIEVPFRVPADEYKGKQPWFFRS